MTQMGSLILKKRERKPTLYYSTEFWNALSKVHLTKSALNELNHRNRHLFTFEFLPKFNLEICPEQLESICQLAREGGPDLIDLRGHPKPDDYAPESGEESQSNSQSSSNYNSPTHSFTYRTKLSDTSKATGPSYQNFETMLTASGAHFIPYVTSDEKSSSIPLNLQEMRERAKKSRASVNPVAHPDNVHYEIRAAMGSDRTKSEVVERLIPILENGIQIQNQGSRDTRFSNLEPLIDGGLDQRVPVMETLDRCYGAPWERLSERVRKDLSGKVVPTHQPSNPIAPNFFVELKGPEGRFFVAERQALYYGVLGERGQIALRSWGYDRPVLDGMAHTIVCTLVSSELSFFSIHAARSSDHSNSVEYFMCFIDRYFIGFEEAERSAISAYQNLLEYAEEKRNEAIELANTRARQLGDAPE